MLNVKSNNQALDEFTDSQPKPKDRLSTDMAKIEELKEVDDSRDPTHNTGSASQNRKVTVENSEKNKEKKSTFELEADQPDSYEKEAFVLEEDAPEDVVHSEQV